MALLPLALSTARRQVAGLPDVLLRNVFLEPNATLSEGQPAVIARPGRRRGPVVGDGPIRGLHHSAGNFANALFVASGTDLYRVATDYTFTKVGSNLAPSQVKMASTAFIGTTPEYLFIADGQHLWLYIEQGYATATLSGSPADGDIVEIGNVFYQFTSDTTGLDGSPTSGYLTLPGTTPPPGQWPDMTGTPVITMMPGTMMIGYRQNGFSSPSSVLVMQPLRLNNQGDWQLLPGTRVGAPTAVPDASNNVTLNVGDTIVAYGDDSSETSNTRVVGTGHDTWLWPPDYTQGQGLFNDDPITLQAGQVFTLLTAATGVWTPANPGPQGTADTPWLVALGATDADSFQNLFDAVNEYGTPGTTYSSLLVMNPDIQAIANSSNFLTVRANTSGATGNDLTLSTSSTTMSWSGTTLSGGGEEYFEQVQTPNGVGMIDVAYCMGYVICVPSQEADINGRFYWIEPGETTIQELDYATAERAPDAISGVTVFNDQFWLPGSSTTEVWYFTGTPASPVQRVQGLVIDRGAWAGTMQGVKESMIMVDPDGGVFQISGGLQRISGPNVEERIRVAIGQQAKQEASA
jgi:hypothetical protein